MTQSRTLSSGMDVPKDSMAVASVATTHHAEVVSLGPRGTRQGAIAKRLRRLPSHSAPLVLVSEAGPCGSGRDHSRTTQGQVCWGVAPSVLPQKPGDRGKTNRRDALQLARLRRAGALTHGSGPTVDAEARRDLCRARDEPLHALKAAQLRLPALLLRQDSR